MNLKTENDLTLKNTLDRLQNVQKSKINSKESEIEATEKAYDAKLLALRDQEELGLLNTKLDYDKKKLETIDQNEKVLGLYKDNLEKSKKQIELEKQFISENYKKNALDVNQNQQEQMSEKLESFSQRAKEIEAKSNTEIKGIEAKSDSKIMSSQTQNRVKINSAIAEHKKEVVENDIRRNHELHSSEVEHKHQRVDQKMAHDKEVYFQKGQQKKDIEDQKLRHSEIVNNQERLFSAELTQKQGIQNQKISGMIKTHEDMMNDLRTKFDAELQSLVKNHTKSKQEVSRMQEDKFYHVTKINPTVEDKGNEYIVSIKVPEHEKETVNLTTQGRTVRLSLSRKFSEELNDDDGTHNVSKRSEIMSKSFQLPEIMKSKEIRQEYVDGTLKYKIPKA